MCRHTQSFNEIKLHVALNRIMTIMKRNMIFVLCIIMIFFLSSYGINYASAQHHGAPPPMASLGDRNIIMNFAAEPNVQTPAQDIQMKMNLIDEKSGEPIQHVTYRMSISKDHDLKASEFFHSHPGPLTIVIKNVNSSHVTTGATFDVLTNAMVPDPSGIIIMTGPIFSETGIYNIDFEITGLDNDKTDLQSILEYHYVKNISDTLKGE